MDDCGAPRIEPPLARAVSRCYKALAGGLRAATNPVHAVTDNRMLKNLYLIGLATLLLAALGGLSYCLALAAQDDPRGLANIGKLLLLSLYGAYRLRSILDRRYQIYRAWEPPRARRVKGLLHGALAFSLCLLAAAMPAALAGVIPLAPAALVPLVALLVVFLALETVNGLHRDPMAAYEQAR